ncbi:MAG: beta strand repeat-containing protein, partial [Planctomycetota bacterium]
MKAKSLNRLLFTLFSLFMLLSILSNEVSAAVARTGSQEIITHTGEMTIISGSGTQDNWEYVGTDYTVSSQASTSEIKIGNGDNWTDIVEVSSGHTVKAVAGGPTDAAIEIEGGYVGYAFTVTVNGTVESKSTSDAAILISGRTNYDTDIEINDGGEVDAGSSTNYAIQDTGGGATDLDINGESDITGIIDLGAGNDDVEIDGTDGDVEIDGDLIMGAGTADIDIDAEDNEVEMDAIDVSSATSSTIVVTSETTGSVEIDEFVFSDNNDDVTISGNTTIAKAIDLKGGNDDFTFTSEHGGTITDFQVDAGTGNDEINITAAGGNNLAITLIDFSDGGSNELTLTATAATMTVTTLTTSSEADNITIVGGVTVTNGIDTGDESDTLNISGTGFDLGAGNETIKLGAGNDSFSYDADHEVKVDAGEGNDSFDFKSTSSAYTISDLDLSDDGDNKIEIDGTNVITVNGITCGSGNDEIEAEGATVFDITTAGSVDIIDLGAGDDKFIFTSETNGSIDNQTIDTGSGTNTVTLDAATSNISGITIDLTDGGSNDINLNDTGTGSITVTNINCGAGSDDIDVQGATTITNAVDLKGGNDTFTFTSAGGATLGTFTITSGSGDDTIDLTAAGGFNRTVTSIDLSGGGTNTVNLDTDSSSTLTVNGITCGTDSDTINVSGATTVAGALALDAGNDKLTFTSKDGATLGGSITGAAGDDTFNITCDTNAIAVDLDAGDGNDTVNFTVSGADLTITTLTLGTGNDTVSIVGDGITAGDSDYIQNIDLSASAGENTLELDNIYFNGTVTLGAGNTLRTKTSSYLTGALTAAGAGNSISVRSSAVLTVDGAVSLTDTDFGVAISDSASGKITATAGNNITIAGTSTVTPVISGYVEDQARYTILETSGTGTVGGTFSSVNYQSDGLFLSFDLDYSADKVELVA